MIFSFNFFLKKGISFKKTKNLTTSKKKKRNNVKEYEEVFLPETKKAGKIPNEKRVELTDFDNFAQESSSFFFFFFFFFFLFLFFFKCSFPFFFFFF